MVAILDNWWDQCTPFRKGTTQWLFGPHLVSFHPVVLMKILRFKTFYLIRSNGKVIRDIFRRRPFKEYHIQDWSNICLVFLKKIEMWKVNGIHAMFLYVENCNIYIIVLHIFMKGIFLRNSLTKNTIKIRCKINALSMYK